MEIEGFDPRLRTQAYDQWAETDNEIRAFLAVVSRLLDQEFTGLWSAIESEPGDPDGRETPDVFHQRVEGGVWPDDHAWMLLAATVKDAVTAYEVYLEQALDEVLRRHGFELVRKNPDLGPRWPVLTQYYEDLFALTISPPEVDVIRDLRHVLTHQRGVWRSEDQAERLRHLANPDGEGSWRVPLAADAVVGYCDVLAAKVKEFDPTLWRFSWGNERPPALPPDPDAPESPDKWIAPAGPN